MSLFNARFTELRIKKSVPQEVLAEYLGKTRGTISNYELGKSEPSYDDLIKLAEYFNVTIDYLLGRPNAEKHFFDKHATDTEDEIIIHNHLKYTEAALRQGNISEENLHAHMKFTEFMFRRDLEEEKKGKKNS